MTVFNQTFQHPYLLWLLAGIPVLLFWDIVRRNKKYPVLNFSNTDKFLFNKKTIKFRLFQSLVYIRAFAMALLVIAFARPHSTTSFKDVSFEGIDIIISQDISGSMLAEDLKPNRLESAKRMAQKFIDNRRSDRIGLVAFSGESFTQCPLTVDHAVLKNLFTKLESGMIEDGTAIGNGLATAINRIKDSKAKSKIIIVLTDGINNSGEVDPITAAEMAQQFDIRVYTIGIGTLGQAPYPFQTPFGIQYQMVDVQIDEPLLKQIAALTDGKYFRATNSKKLELIYNEIDKLEKTKFDVTSYSHKKELFFPYAFVALLLLTLELLLSKLFIRRLV